jgi:biotin transport system substrate-specific component
MAIAAPQPRVLADVVPHTWARQLVLVAGGAAFVGLSAQIAIPLPFTPVPLTLQTFAVLLTGAALGSLRGVLAMALYAVVGIAGVPWFAQGSSGYAAPSFGYILGFIAAAFIVGRIAEGGAHRMAHDRRQPGHLRRRRHVAEVRAGRRRRHGHLPRPDTFRHR